MKSMDDNEFLESYINILGDVEGKEGGDTTTDIFTRELGIVDTLGIDPADYPNNPRGLAKAVAEKNIQELKRIGVNWDELPLSMKYNALDMQFNFGSLNVKAKNYLANLKTGNYAGAINETLDALSASDPKDGKQRPVKGIALRRAKFYNLVASDLGIPLITSVDAVNQDNAQKSAMFTYKLDDGKDIVKPFTVMSLHSRSVPGIEKVLGFEDKVVIKPTGEKLPASDLEEKGIGQQTKSAFPATGDEQYLDQEEPIRDTGELVEPEESRGILDRIKDFISPDTDEEKKLKKIRKEEPETLDLPDELSEARDFSVLRKMYQDKKFNEGGLSLSEQMDTIQDPAVKQAKRRAKERTTDKTELEKLKDVAKFGAEFIPGVGEAMAVKRVSDALDEKDYVGAGIETAAGALGLIPVVGDMAGKALRTTTKTLRKDAKLKIDNPGYDSFYEETYAEGKQKLADAEKKRALELGHTTGYPLNIGTADGVTGVANQVKFKPEELKDIPGSMGEEKFRASGEKLQRLKESIKEEGYKEDPIMIHVREDGQPFIVEGNHRLAEALESGRDTITADIRYLRGAEEKAGVLDPKNIFPSETSEAIPVMPINQSNLTEKGFDYKPGGQYVNPITKEILTGKKVGNANIKIVPSMGVKGGRPMASFNVSDLDVPEVGTTGKGKSDILVNLVKPTTKGNKAGWSWNNVESEEFSDINTLVSVTQKDKHYYTLETEFLKGAELKTYPKNSSEPRLRPTVKGEIDLQDEVGKINLRGKTHPVYRKITAFASGGLALKKGGAVPMKEQMSMFEDGGLMDEGNTIDPISGNDVPPGSTQEEVRDDIPAQLSEGEFVFPADVVRYIGLEKLMQMRQQAKMGLQTMDDMGQMGNSEEAVMPDNLPFELSDLDMDDDPVEMNTGGVAGVSTVPSQVPATSFVQAPPPATTMPIPPTPTPAPVPVAPTYTPPTQQAPPIAPDYSELTYKDVMSTPELAARLVDIINPTTGEKRTISFIPGVTSIPDGFVLASEYTAPETQATSVTPVAGQAQVRKDDDDDDDPFENQRKIREDQARIDLAKSLGYTPVDRVFADIFGGLKPGEISVRGYVSDGEGNLFDPETGKIINKGFINTIKDAFTYDKLGQDIIDKARAQETEFGRDLVKRIAVNSIDTKYNKIRDNAKDDDERKYIDDVVKEIKTQVDKGNVDASGKIINPFEANRSTKKTFGSDRPTPVSKPASTKPDKDKRKPKVTFTQTEKASSKPKTKDTIENRTRGKPSEASTDRFGGRYQEGGLASKPKPKPKKMRQGGLASKN